MNTVKVSIYIVSCFVFLELLYTDEKNPELEDQVEAVLNSHELFWTKSEVWIESEKLYEVLYQMTV